MGECCPELPNWGVGDREKVSLWAANTRPGGAHRTQCHRCCQACRSLCFQGADLHLTVTELLPRTGSISSLGLITGRFVFSFVKCYLIPTFTHTTTKAFLWITTINLL